MENQTYYLLCSLIIKEESTSTEHKLFADKNAAINAIDEEIKCCSDNFYFDESNFEHTAGNHYEWRNQDGYGFEVWIEQITLIK